MTIYQLMYDVMYYPLGLYTPPSNGYSISFVFILFGGSSSSFMSNVMIFSMLYIILYMKTYELKDKVFLVNAISNLPGLFCVMLFIINTYDSSSTSSIAIEGPSIYYYLRLISIILNIMVLVYIRYLLYKLKAVSRHDPKTIFRIKVISTVVHRLEYYPLVQTISRVGYAWYDLQYGYDYSIANVDDPLELFCAFFAMIVTPLAAVGYLIIFLKMQPRAYRHLMTRCLTGKRLVQDGQNTENIKLDAQTAWIRKSTTFKSQIQSPFYGGENSSSFDIDRGSNRDSNTVSDYNQSALSVMKKMWKDLQDDDVKSSFDQAIDDADIFMQDIDDDELFGLCEMDKDKEPMPAIKTDDGSICLVGLSILSNPLILNSQLITENNNS